MLTDSGLRVESYQAEGVSVLLEGFSRVQAVAGETADCGKQLGSPLAAEGGFVVFVERGGTQEAHSPMIVIDR
jgi:hypothetical protein